MYFSVEKEAKDKARNLNRRADIERKMDSIKDESFIIQGDFNGHLGFLGSQKCNDNGNNHNLTLLNLKDKCNGTYTWRRNDQKSAIDFVLVNQAMYRLFEEMAIDETNDIVDISDHNLLSTKFTFKNNGGTHFKSNKWITRVKYSKDPKALEEFKNKVED